MRMHLTEPRHVGRRSNRSGARFCKCCAGRQPYAGTVELHEEGHFKDMLLEDLVPRVPGGIMKAMAPGLGSQGTPGTWQPEYEWQAEPREFPFANSQWSSGCVWDLVMTTMRVRLRYCPTCREVQRQWRFAHSEFARQPYGSLDEAPVIEGKPDTE